MMKERIVFSAGLVHFAPSTGIFRTMSTDGADPVIQDFPATPGLLIRRSASGTETKYTLEAYQGQEIGHYTTKREYPVLEGNFKASLRSAGINIDGIGLSDILDISTRKAPIGVQDVHSYSLDYRDLAQSNYHFCGAVITCIEPHILRVVMYYDQVPAILPGA